MVAVVFWGLLTPFFVSSLGAVCVFFLKRSLGDWVPGSDQLRFWRHGSRIHSESANPRCGAVRLGGDLGLSVGGHRFLGPVFFFYLGWNLISHLHQRSTRAEGSHTRLQ